MLKRLSFTTAAILAALIALVLACEALLHWNWR